MADFPSHLEADGLFGYLSPSVKLRLPDRITILTGPNGSGKTHLLRLLHDLAALDVRDLARVPLHGVELEYQSGKALAVRRSFHGTETELEFRGSLPGRESFGPQRFAVSTDSLDAIPLPDYIERVDEDTWMDLRDGEIVGSEELLARYWRPYGRGRRPEPVVTPSEWPPSWIEDHFTPASPPTFIATGRLELSAPSTETPRVRHAVAGTVRRAGTAARIRQYVDRIRAEVAEARRASLAVSQQADQGFASHALDKARETVKESELRARWEGIAALHRDLHSNGLTAESPGVALPVGRTNPTERRVLNVFLADWDAKLRPLVPIHEKLQLLRDIVGAKMRGKTLEIENGEPHFIGHAGDPISVEMLSSGEQHLLALFTMLLFEAGSGSLVLIDEPEISLHAAWKHAFLDDIGRVATINDLQVVLATHSTAIINGRWELVEELEVLG